MTWTWKKYRCAFFSYDTKRRSVHVRSRAASATVDPDLREYHRKQALSALAKRYSPKKLAPLTTKPPRKKSKPLFAPEDGDVDESPSDDEMDPDLISAIQDSLNDEEARELMRAIEVSKAESLRAHHAHDIPGSNIGASSSRSTLDNTLPQTPRAGSSSHDLQLLEDMRGSDDDLYASPTRLETALSIANAGPKKPSPTQQRHPLHDFGDFGTPTLLLSSEQQTTPPSQPLDIPDSEDDDMEEVPVVISPPCPPQDVSIVDHSAPMSPLRSVSPVPLVVGASLADGLLSEDGDVEKVLPAVHDPPTIRNQAVPLPAPSTRDTSDLARTIPEPDAGVQTVPADVPSRLSYVPADSAAPASNRLATVVVDESRNQIYEAPQPVSQPSLSPYESSSSESDAEPWSRPASPSEDLAMEAAKQAKADDDWDAAQEMDPHAEESEYAQFISQVRGRNLDEVRKEIDDEIRNLNEQRKVAMRDSEDITQQMISQIMVRTFCLLIPWVD